MGVVLVFGAMVMCSVMHGDHFALLGAGIQYWIMQPVFWNILQVSAVQ